MQIQPIEINEIVIPNSAIKRVLQSEDLSKAEAPYKKAVSVIDKMVSKGHLKKNTAARRKSQITRHFNSLSK